MSASASIVAPSAGASTTSSSPERSVAELNTAAVSCASRPRSTGAKLAVTRPDSKRERSSSALTSRSSRSALRWATSIRSRWTAGSGSGSASASPSGPSMSVSGVRNSCETLEKNSVLARSSSASSSARVCAASRPTALVSAPESWRATMRKKSR